LTKASKSENTLGVKENRSNSNFDLFF